MERSTMEMREVWVAEAVRAIRAVKVDPSSAEPKPVPPPPDYPHPPITAREWLRIREQRAMDIAYTQNVAAEIALKRLLKGGE